MDRLPAWRAPCTSNRSTSKTRHVNFCEHRHDVVLPRTACSRQVNRSFSYHGIFNGDTVWMTGTRYPCFPRGGSKP